MTRCTWGKENRPVTEESLALVEVDEFEGVDHSDYPDYVDSYPYCARWTDTGESLNADELDALETLEGYDAWKYEELMRYLH